MSNFVKYQTEISFTLLDNCMRYQAKNEIYFGEIQRIYPNNVLIIHSSFFGQQMENFKALELSKSLQSVVWIGI